MAYRRRFKRSGFKRRARPKTYWLTGRSFSFTEDIFALEPVDSIAGGQICHSCEVNLFDAGDFASHGGDGFVLHRIVGQIRHLVTMQDEQNSLISNGGADVRRSFQKKRVYAQATISAQAGEAIHSHMFSQIELGDEDIMHTASFFQPSLFNDLEVTPFINAVLSQRPFIQQFAGAGNDQFESDPWSNFWADQIGPSVRDIDIRCHRKVMQDDQPFLYYDVRDAIGNINSETAPGLRLQGYLRFLVTKGR